MAEWSDETIERLRRLWEEGLSSSAIGRQLGYSKNAIIGKARRIGLSGRPSPIKSDSPTRPRIGRPKPIGDKPTLPSLAGPVFTAPSAPIQFRAPKPPVTRPIEIRETVQAALSVALPKFRGECSWPIGDPGTRSFRYCLEPALFACPYCPTHKSMAYVRPRDRREDEAAA